MINHIKEILENHYNLNNYDKYFLNKSKLLITYSATLKDYSSIKEELVKLAGKPSLNGKYLELNEKKNTVEQSLNYLLEEVTKINKVLLDSLPTILELNLKEGKDIEPLIMEFNSILLCSVIHFNGEDINPLWIETYHSGDGHIDNAPEQKQLHTIYLIQKDSRTTRADITFGNANFALSSLLKIAYVNNGKNLCATQTDINKYFNSKLANKGVENKIEIEPNPELFRNNYNDIAYVPLVGVSKKNTSCNGAFLASKCYIKTYATSLKKKKD